MLDVNELKRSADVPGLIGRRIQLKKEGDHFVACCPFHAEKTPSWKLDKRQGDWLWKCFGCGKGGDVVTFLELYDRLTTKQAIEVLAQAAGVNKEWHEHSKQVTDTFKPLVESKEKVTFTLEQWSKFEAALTTAPAAVKWLIEVRAVGEDTIKRLRLGYTQTYKGKLPQNVEHVRDKGWVMFPRIEHKKVVAVKLRSIEDKVFTQIANMESRSLFNVETIDPLEPVFVTEGELDACILEQAGYRAVSVPAAGTDLEPKDKQALKLAECIYLAGDMDMTGTQYMQKLLREFGKNTYWLTWPGKVKDASDFFRESCTCDVEVFYTEVQRLMTEARNRPPENVESLLTIMRQSQGSDLENDPDRLHFPPDLVEVDRMTYTPKGGVALIFSTYSGTGKSMFKTQILLHEARRGEVVVDLSPELRKAEYTALVTSQIKGRELLGGLRRTGNVPEEHIHAAADMLDVRTAKGTDFRYYVGFDVPGQTEEEVLEFLRSTITLLSATRFAIDTFHRLIHADKGNQVEAEGRMIKKLEALGLELGCIFILICQSNAEAEGLEHLKRNEHGVLRGSREIRDIPASIYLLHRNRRPQRDGEDPDDIMELETVVFAKKTRFKGPGKPQVKLRLMEQWSLFVPLAYGGAPKEEEPVETFSL